MLNCVHRVNGINECVSRCMLCEFWKNTLVEKEEESAASENKGRCCSVISLVHSN
jgi:hypothetical protein